ncbi:MAG: ribonuclease domain-containing protein [Sporolactobacillus sp.]
MGLYDTVKDTVVDLWQMITSPPEQVAGDLVRAAIHPQQTYAIIKNAIVQSYDKNMVQGNAYTRSQWITYAVATIALSFVGTKGIDKVGKMGDAGKLVKAAGTADKVGTVTKTTLVRSSNTVAENMNGFQNSISPKFQFAGGNVPYNTIDAKGLKDKLLNTAVTRNEAVSKEVNRTKVSPVSKFQQAFDVAGGAKNIIAHQKYKEVLKTTQDANPLVERLRVNGQLPDNYVTKKEAKEYGWEPGKVIENYISGGQIGGDIFKNRSKILPIAKGRVWYEGDVGLDGNISRAKQPGTRLVYSNDGLMYITTDHYKTVHYIGTYK